MSSASSSSWLVTIGTLFTPALTTFCVCASCFTELTVTLIPAEIEAPTAELDVLAVLASSICLRLSSSAVVAYSTNLRYWRNPSSTTCPTIALDCPHGCINETLFCRTFQIQCDDVRRGLTSKHVSTSMDRLVTNRAYIVHFTTCVLSIQNTAFFLIFLVAKILELTVTADFPTTEMRRGCDGRDGSVVAAGYCASSVSVV